MRWDRASSAKRWSPRTLSFWLAATGSALAVFPPTRRIAGALLLTVALGGVGAVYGNSAALYGEPVEPVAVLRTLIKAKDKGALQSAVAHGVWLAPAVYLLKAGK